MSISATVDLRRTFAFRLGRGLIRFARFIFAPIPILRDFVPERAVGMFFKAPAGRFVVETLWGQAVVVSPREGGIVEGQLFRYGSYETGVTRLLHSLASPGDSIIDAGANVGAITLPAAAHVGPAGRVYSFEPVATTAAFLRESIALNNFSQVTLNEFALSDRAGTAPIYEEPGVNRGGNSLNAEGHGRLVQEVSLKRLDDVMTAEEWKKVTVMKVDVEGWELEVFLGASALFATGHTPAIIVEYFRDRGGRAQRLYDFLKSVPNAHLYRMAYRKRCEGPLIPVSTEAELPEADNIVLLPDAMKHRVKIISR